MSNLHFIKLLFILFSLSFQRPRHLKTSLRYLKDETDDQGVDLEDTPSESGDSSADTTASGDDTTDTADSTADSGDSTLDASESGDDTADNTAGGDDVVDETASGDDTVDNTAGGDNTTDSTTEEVDNTVDTTTEGGGNTTDTATEEGDNTVDTTTEGGDNELDTADSGDSTVNNTDGGDNTSDTTDSGDSTVDTTDSGDSTVDNTTGGDNTVDTTTDGGDNTVDNTTDGGDDTADTTTEGGDSSDDTSSGDSDSSEDTNTVVIEVPDDEEDLPSLPNPSEPLEIWPIVIDPNNKLLFCSRPNIKDSEVVDILFSEVYIETRDSANYLGLRRIFEGRVLYSNYTDSKTILEEIDPSFLPPYNLWSFHEGRVDYQYEMTCERNWLPLNFPIRFGMLQFRFGEGKASTGSGTNLCERFMDEATVVSYGGADCMLVDKDEYEGSLIVQLREGLEYGSDQRNFCRVAE